MEKSILLQKLVRNNSEDLQKESLEMEAWEKEMKKKDLEIRNSENRNLENDKVLPPIRRKKKPPSISEVSKGQTPNKTKRISSYDYDSWDKFDADKACRDTEDETISIETKQKLKDVSSTDNLEREHEEAIKLKEEGNAMVQKQEYSKAVGKYNAAISIFPNDATFYANRALCQWKLNNLCAAESDCTQAILLDKLYLKAYHRRAKIRMERCRYEDAKVDIEKLLELSPTNKEYKFMLAKVKQQLGKSNKFLDKTIDISLEDKDVKPSSSKDGHVAIKQVIDDNEDSIKKINKTKKYDNKQDCNSMPSWLPKLKEGVSLVEPLTEPPQRVNQTLNRIQILELPDNQSIFKDIEAESKRASQISIKKKENLSNTSNAPSVHKNEITTSASIANDQSKTEDTEKVPPPPKSSVAFILNWQKNKCLDFRYKYLKQITPCDLPGIFKESMESNIFSEILIALNTKFVPNKENVFDYLHFLSELKRFRALLLFMTQTDKEILETLFDWCKTNDGKTEEEVKKLRSAYEM